MHLKAESSKTFSLLSSTVRFSLFHVRTEVVNGHEVLELRGAVEELQADLNVLRDHLALNVQSAWE